MHKVLFLVKYVIASILKSVLFQAVRFFFSFVLVGFFWIFLFFVSTSVGD